jgi:hypothetical protein
MGCSIEEKCEGRSVWRVLKGGFHESVAAEIIKRAEESKRLPTLEGIVRMTCRRIGQEMAGLAGFRVKSSLTDDTSSVLRLLPTGWAEELAEAIEGHPKVRRLVAGGDWREAVKLISRMTGRAVGVEVSITITKAAKLGARLGG